MANREGTRSFVVELSIYTEYEVIVMPGPDSESPGISAPND